MRLSVNAQAGPGTNLEVWVYRDGRVVERHACLSEEHARRFLEDWDGADGAGVEVVDTGRGSERVSELCAAGAYQDEGFPTDWAL